MKVKIIYRNYKPLHSMYLSIVKYPPKGVEVDLPNPNQWLAKMPLLFKIYRRLGRNKLLQSIINKIEPILFVAPSNNQTNNPDIYHFINMIPKKPQTIPFIVEFEHVGALFSFVFDKRQETNVKNVLSSSNCRAIVCSTKAAQKTLKDVFKKDYPKISSKTFVIYPALDRQISKLPNRTDLGKRSGLNLLFIGNDSYRKGLEEILVALTSLDPKTIKKLSLVIVSNDAAEIIKNFPSLKRQIKLYLPEYSKQEIIDNFYLNSDIFLLPTKQDTFGFVLLDALSSGTPIISTRQFAIPEIVTSGHDGKLLKISHSVLDEGVYFDEASANQVNYSNLDKLLVNNLTKAIKELNLKRQLLTEYSQNMAEKIGPGGRFSITKRNHELLKVYNKAVEHDI